MNSSNYKLSMQTMQYNNYAVTKLKEGKAIEAFHLLSKACRAANRAQKGKDYISCTNRMYQYTWLDCSKALAHKMTGTRSFNDGSLPFLFLQFLWIEPPMECSSMEHDMDDEQMSVHVRGFIWVLWYNLATVSILLGSPVGASGNRLLKQSLDLFRLVQSVVDPQPLSKHWVILKLSILNNEACVLSELSESRQRLDRLIKMGLALSNMSDLLGPEDREQFIWTVKSMADDRFAAAA
ncbi:unnamed protein product [Cylindrotheca closterium]|uniref:Uncharacterized protein n=1 Tax=Cylindrotheca closterium TaxID=2856 RepID=A0AAD2GAT2_9STRA|nr:unnamed protein product [Cylindrotheca closterium]